jgi:hypothetical protein
MKELRRKVLLPTFQLSELTTEDDPRAIKRTIKQGKGHAALTYHYRLVRSEEAGRGFNYNLFPVVLDRQSTPWLLGTLFILSQLEGETRPIMATYQSRADDLGAYKEWLDTQDEPDKLLFAFPKIKLRRPTYRYRGYLQQQIQAAEIAPATAKRRMGAVINFYRWLVANNYFQPEYPTWEERQYQLVVKTTEGRILSKRVSSTDVSIKAPGKAPDPSAGTIPDGGMLRPLTGKEQEWILDATWAKGNTECYLIQLVMLGTGVRIQTAGTLRLRHFVEPNPRFSKSPIGTGEVYRLKAGPGTNIDTKKDKSGTLQIPRPLYDLLHTYAVSQRAQVRRERFTAKHGEHIDPYLFLTQQGTPYFTAKAETMRFNPNLERRHEKVGQPIRQFIKDHAIPFVQEKHDKIFHYRIHDLRASFGMNMTEELTKQVSEGKITLHKARMIVKDLMWHQSFATTDLYLDFRGQIDSYYEAINGYGETLQRWTERMMKGMPLDE